MLKMKHAYYGQVQLGMAISNVTLTDFIVYSSFDNTIIVMKFEFDAGFADEMLRSLKLAYFGMNHYVCQEERLSNEQQ